MEGDDEEFVVHMFAEISFMFLVVWIFASDFLKSE